MKDRIRHMLELPTALATIVIVVDSDETLYGDVDGSLSMAIDACEVMADRLREQLKKEAA